MMNSHQMENKQKNLSTHLLSVLFDQETRQNAIPKLKFFLQYLKFVVDTHQWLSHICRMFCRKVIKVLFLLFRAVMEAFSFVLNCRSETKCFHLAQTWVVVVESHFRRNVFNKAHNPSCTRNVAAFKRRSLFVHHYLSLSHKPVPRKDFFAFHLTST